MSSTVPTLGYFRCRGLAQPIRLLLNYSGIVFNDKQYEFGPGQSYADIQTIQQQWLPDKFNLGLDFPNIPYFIDGNTKLTQSMTILRYLGRKNGLVANDEKSLAKQDMAEQQVHDLQISFLLKIVMNTTDDKEKIQQLIDEIVVPQLTLLAKFLGHNQWLANGLTYVDFLAYETFDWIRIFSPQTIGKFGTISDYLKRFETLPAIMSYMSSPEFISWPVLGPVAKWGHTK